eukprot:scaffold34894_cov354-Skeletonema_menzelii.AAC.1
MEKCKFRVLAALTCLCHRQKAQSSRGCLFVAVRGGGCYEIPLHILEQCLLGHTAAENSIADLPWKRLHVTANDGTAKLKHEATFCLGVERGFSDPK